MVTGLPNDMFGRVSAEGALSSSIDLPISATQDSSFRAPAHFAEQETDDRRFEQHDYGRNGSQEQRSMIAEQAAAHAAEEARKLEQSVIDFEPEERGIFEKISPTMYDGENLDIPPWIRNRSSAVFKAE
jgi:hypothetical protein